MACNHLTCREAECHKETFYVDLWYPGTDGDDEYEKIQHIEVGLVDVRAADSIRIHYDFDRDGYSIEQASKFSWEAGDEVCDSGWKEVAFVKAWARDEEGK